MLRKLISGWFAARTAAVPAHKPAHELSATPVSLKESLKRADRLARAGELVAALDAYRACATSEPGLVQPHLGMANVLVDLWDIEAALREYEMALDLAPQSSEILSAVIFHSHYLHALDEGALFDLHRRFGTLVARAGAQPRVPKKLTDPARRIRVGYVSHNFSRHSVGYFIEPVIANHDRSRFEIYCYSSHPKADDTTERIRRQSDHWRDISAADDDKVEAIICRDAIDVLVDLAGHSKGNRLAVFARKPAPVQMSWLGYPDTSGVDAIDYRITDPVADPGPAAETRHTERLLRIDGIFLTYQPPADSPLVSARADADIVFGSFNNIAKVNEPTLVLWANILDRVPRSRLVLKSAALHFPETAERVLERCEHYDIDPARLELQTWINDRRGHLDAYAGIDIALDTYPYNGTTTTCEALWMGVPVVTLAGDAHISRVGATLLNTCGLNDCVAQTRDEYSDIAVALAADSERRADLRARLRSSLEASPLLDHEGYTRKLESKYRQALDSPGEVKDFSAPAN